MRRKAILAVEDDEEVRQLYRRIFSEHASKYLLNVVSSGPEALKFLAVSSCNCVILDLAMSGMDGFAVLKHIRAKPALRDLPVLVVTGSKEDRDGVRALALGADDYICKPFSVAIFEAKIEKWLQRAEESLRRRSGARTQVLKCGPLRMDLANRKVFLSGSELRLTEKEFDLLYCLLRRSPGLVRWDDVHSEVWKCYSGITVKQSQVLQVTLSHLKAKLGPEGAGMIILQKGHGLRLEIK